MKSTIRIFFVSILIITSSCLSSKSILQFRYFDNGVKMKCELEIMNDFVVSETSSDDGYKEVRANMKDSSVIYITDNNKSGGGDYNAKIKKYSKDVFIKILSHDTIDLCGVYNELYWREVKCGVIVCGYYNASYENSIEYDKILNQFLSKCKDKL